MRRRSYLFNILMFSAIMIGICTLPCFSYEKQDHYNMNKFIAENMIQDFSLDDYLALYVGLEKGGEEIIGRIP